ncbi:type VI secretion system lipoprotein TssJ [Endozoicomonas sp.]|uniref:type VI secretion system lipoprotein TssJ n=1 Tax=Endozoicomonas sp. TaxID=1892382 RepID=UPI002885329D|nr:type VI secretion system lipoprotein TssJ [Endozoicomonas sp.]
MNISILILLIMVLTGCSRSEVQPEPETLLSLTIIAGSEINSGSDINSTTLQGGGADAAPLQLRMYELQSTELFANADFLDIYLQDSATLQSSLIKKHRLPTVWPDTGSQLTWQLDRATRFIAIFAEFANYESAITSALAPIVPGTSNRMILQINGNHLRLSVEPRLFIALVKEHLPEKQPHGSQL